MMYIFSRIRLVVVLAVVAVGMTAGVVTLTNNGGAGSRTIYAEFPDASPLIVGNDVKVRGVKVGQISSIGVDHGVAKVGMQLNPSAMPVHVDARTTIRPVSLLGERFVDLDRGRPSSPELPDGAVLPPQQNGKTTDLDQVLNTVDKPTGDALAALMTSLGEGVQGQGRDVDAAVRALSPAMHDTNSLVGILNQQNALLNSLVDKTQPVASALAADRGKRLDNLVGSTNLVLGTTAANQQQVDASLAQLPGTMASARRSLSQVAGVADQTTPTLAAIRPTTDNLNGISNELQQLSASADPALASAQPVLNRAKELLDQAQPVVRDLNSAGPDLRGTTSSARPIANALLGNLNNVLDFVRFWALTTNGRDGLSHYFRAHLVASPETAVGPIPAPPAGQGGVPGAPVPGAPGMPKVPGLPPVPTIPNLPGLSRGPAVAPPGEPGGSATGLSNDQERSMFDQLLGGQ